MYLEKISTRLNKAEVEAMLLELFPKENQFNIVLVKHDESFFLRPTNNASYPFQIKRYQSYFFVFDLRLDVYERSTGSDILFTWLSKDLSILFAIFIALASWILVICLIATGEIKTVSILGNAVLTTILWLAYRYMVKKDELVSTYIQSKFHEIDKIA